MGIENNVLRELAEAIEGMRSDPFICGTIEHDWNDLMEVVQRWSDMEQTDEPHSDEIASDSESDASFDSETEHLSDLVDALIQAQNYRADIEMETLLTDTEDLLVHSLPVEAMKQTLNMLDEVNCEATSFT